jgi:hypothetical protein
VHSLGCKFSPLSPEWLTGRESWIEKPAYTQYWGRCEMGLSPVGTDSWDETTDLTFRLSPELSERLRRGTAITGGRLGGGFRIIPLIPSPAIYCLLPSLLQGGGMHLTTPGILFSTEKVVIKPSTVVRIELENQCKSTLYIFKHITNNSLILQGRRTRHCIFYRNIT